MPRRRLLAGFVAVFLPTASLAVVPPRDESPLRQKEFRHADLYYGNVFRPMTELPADITRRLVPDLGHLGIDPGNAFFDLRTGRWGTLIVTRPLIPGSGVGNELQWSGVGQTAPSSPSEIEHRAWEAFRAFLANNLEVLRIDPAELAEPVLSTVADRVIQIDVGRRVDGLQVRNTFVNATLNNGNLVLMGQRNWGKLKLETTPTLPSDRAARSLLRHLDGIPVARFRHPPRLEILPVSDQSDETKIRSGAGLQHRLVWVLTPRFRNDRGTWEALVDAHDGELLAFQDTNRYASRRVGGGIYPVSNDGIPPDGVEQPGYPMPFADIALDGNPLGFTTTGGNAPPGSDVGTISTTLDGRFFRMNDQCGAIDESVTTGDLDLGDGSGTNCTVPPDRSPGDTHASRTGFYELNRLAEQARGYLPSNPWLDLQLTANMNINNNCNAFWDGFSVNFYREGNGCGNTGEIAAIFDHEWGHGLDDNDGNGSISSPGESIADIIAQNRLNESCVGRGFLLGQNCGGYGDPCLDCSGVRESDWEKRQSGVPHDIDWILSSIGGERGGCEGLVGSGGPCGQETHCEGTIVAEAAWDLVHRDLQGFEGSPFELDPNTALELGTRLAYYGSSAVSNWYQCNPGEETGDGCNADGGYLNFLAVDDDNGSLEDGTPHMSALHSAFDRHQIACPTPMVQDSGCSTGPTEAPTNLSAIPFDEGVQLSWDPVAGASEYWVFRTEGVYGCDFGKAKVGNTTSTDFTETGLRNDFEVFYSVVAAGDNTACTGRMSPCEAVTPQPGPDGILRGIVTDELTSAPIEGVLVEAVGLVTRTAITDATGSYSISAPIVGAYDVTASRNAYLPATVSGVVVSEKEATTLDFTLAPVPIADVSPRGLWFDLPAGGNANATVNIGNFGARQLAWSLVEGTPVAAPDARGTAPELDEPIAIPDFSIDSAANGGDPVAFTLAAGELTRGRVDGFHFTGTATGISGEISLASDTCMIVQAPNGTTYSVGGFHGTVAGCGEQDWDFQGSDSGDDGTYESEHSGVLSPPVDDLGDWTFTFVNDWDSTDAATITWSDVTVTLHKAPLPICDDIGDVSWLSAAPDSGSTPPGGADTVDVLVDTSGLSAGTYEAGLCVATDDPENVEVSVSVTLSVTPGTSTPVDLEVDPGSPASDGNGIFEPGELVEVAAAWRNEGVAPKSLAGSTTDFTGPDGASYTLSLDEAEYGTVEPGETASCRDTGICYYLGLDNPMRPVRHWDATVDETLSDGTPRTWTLHIGDSFVDVPRASPFYASIETLLHSGVTGGCTDTEYCPGDQNTRAQMPVFMLRALEDPDYAPPPCVEGDERFADVPAANAFCPWIEDLANRGVTSGCGGGSYCPASPVSRAQMAVFLLKTIEEDGYTPPGCSGKFTDVTCPSLFANWIEDLAARGITGGCTATEYCPGDAVTRAQMAVFISRAFGFTLYGP